MSSRRGGQSSRRGVARLPPIAPREEQRVPSSGARTPHNPISDLPRSEMAPRSRNGCQTCRGRKVKCDEARPECQQCLRLGKICDFSPKWKFRNETIKTVEKYLGSEVADQGWDPTLETARRQLTPLAQDRLPPFTSLSTEEDWQKKAEYRPPGTFFVVANSSSFEDAEDYRHSGAQSATSSEQSEATASNIPVDPDTLILGTIDDGTRKYSTTTISNIANPNISSTPSISSPLLSSFTRSLTQLRVSPPEQASREAIDGNSASEPAGWSEAQLWYHYRTVVRRHLLHTHGFAPHVAAGLEDSFEKEAEHFAPLHHALLALSALSLACRDGLRSVMALQHYQQALSPLQTLMTEQDLASNGAFLTHFILLLYEIAGTDSELRLLHISSLIRIIKTRRSVLEVEPFPYVIWWICMIDINALLSGSGSGDLIRELIQNGIVPTVTEMQGSQAFLGSGALFAPEDSNLMSTAWGLQRELALVAAKIGQASAHMRKTAANQRGHLDPAQIGQGLRAASGWRDELKNAWETQMQPNLAARVGNGTLSEGISGVYDYAQLTYSVCIIYTHTMMWPGQRLSARSAYPTPRFDYDDEAFHILEVASRIADQKHLERRFAVFPLLLVGTFANLASEKMRAQELMETFGSESVGSNTRATMRLLQAVCERQTQRMTSAGHCLDLDFVGVMQQIGQTIVHFGW